MRAIAYTALILAAGTAGASAQPVGAATQRPGAAAPQMGATPQQRLTEGQSWMVQQESLALSSPYRPAAMSAQLAQERQWMASRPAPLGRPQRQMR